jgi:hypothetical protein
VAYECSSGVIDREGKFHAVEDIDFAPLEEMFRQGTLRMMIERKKITAERAELLRSWVHSGFHVNSDRRVEAGDRRGLESLLEYMERAPVALERLTYRPDGRVLYRGNFHPVLGTDHRLISGEEFLALLVPHVECVIRCYGAASTTIRKKLGWIKKKTGEMQPQPPAVPVLKGEESGFVKVRRRNWARLIMKVWLEDPEVCPKCGERMKVLAAISSPSQDGVIERILRARGEGNPPGSAPSRPEGRHPRARAQEEAPRVRPASSTKKATTRIGRTGSSIETRRGSPAAQAPDPPS